MAVLCEGISVIVRRDAIEYHIDGGWAAFDELVPNSTLCSDGELARVGFMDPGSVRAFVETLESHGLTFMEDMLVIDQVKGPTLDCNWIQFGRFPIGDKPDDRVGMCWLFEGERVMGDALYIKEGSMKLYTPPDWRYEGSLSQVFLHVETDELTDRLDFVRTEGNLDVYRDRDTGKEMFVGKPGRDQGPTH